MRTSLLLNSLALARQLLDSAWARYPAARATIERGAAGLGISPDSAIERVLGLLQCGDSVKLRVTVFVGGFEGNAFAFGVINGRSNIAVPAEAGNPGRSLIHEFTHAVHRAGCAPFRTGFGGSLAELVVTEGLAMRVVQAAVPEHDDEFYTAAPPGWLAVARARRTEILAGVRAHLNDSGPDVARRFTFGKGVTGLSREAYYAGWEVVGAMLRDGMSLHGIATLNPSGYATVVSASRSQEAANHAPRLGRCSTRERCPQTVKPPVVLSTSTEIIVVGRLSKR